MKVYRTIIHGHTIEARSGDWGGQQVLVNGRIVSDKAFAGLIPTAHFFELTDEQDRTRQVEVRWIDTSKLHLGRYRVLISVDGVERCRLEPVDLTVAPNVCVNCGYGLTGLPSEYGEVRCPECGRHTPAPPDQEGGRNADAG